MVLPPVARVMKQIGSPVVLIITTSPAGLAISVSRSTPPAASSQKTGALGFPGQVKAAHGPLAPSSRRQIETSERVAKGLGDQPVGKQVSGCQTGRGRIRKMRRSCSNDRFTAAKHNGRGKWPPGWRPEAARHAADPGKSVSRGKSAGAAPAAAPFSGND